MMKKQRPTVRRHAKKQPKPDSFNLRLTRFDLGSPGYS